MDFISDNLNTTIYIQSETEFNQAKMRGFWEMLFRMLTRRRTELLCFEDMVDNLQPGPPLKKTLQDVPLDKVAGSAGRPKDFTPTFLPRTTGGGGKDRWRMIYTLAVTGAGFPPIVVYKIGSDYFVADGHHRASVARYLGWSTIQAEVTELPLCCAPQSPVAVCC